MTKILTIVGARPQFVKAAALSRELRKHPSIQELIVHTGQHFEKNMSDIFFEEMEIPKPHYNLEINSLSHGAMTGRMLEEIEKVILKEKPDWVLVYGDTNSTIAGALAAKKLHVKVAHVEAGLRSFNIQMPEEVNRILTDRISDVLFCPTQTAVKNLHNEGFKNIDADIVLSGDVMQDAALFYASKLHEKELQTSDFQDNFILCTLHRAENTDDKNRLSQIVEALNEIHHTIKPVVLPLHPRTKKKLDEHNLKLEVNTVNPLGYFDMINLIQKCDLVMTDSGGLQKEAFFFKKHCVTLRDQTEWVELLENGFNTLAGADKTLIIQSVSDMLNKISDFDKDLYGKGKATQRIAEYFL
ncbi:MAG: UDP-N-acetylglucosamine 2-epimerase (non-hydrolyzing) [Bacteroidetes bacterium]|nr:MAG: UDP-N-acetylglucosamine 2-epimerase (non-hydrolyzing) [Bacteroidota bacterium]